MTVTDKLLQVIDRVPAFYDQYRVDDFFTLNEARKLTDFEPKKFDKWAVKQRFGSGATCCAQFVLFLWNPERKNQIGQFDLYRAMGTWDQFHRDVFLAWARDPFFC